MTTAPLPPVTLQPEGSIPDVHIYPVGAFRVMPSMAHELARTLTTGLLRTVAPDSDLVASELAVLWDPRDLREHLIPDILVALGVGQADPVYGILRRQYRIWHEGAPPDLILEFASPSTVGKDTLGKKEDYAAMGVREYVQFDPLGELMQPGLRAYRLVGGTYREVAPAEDGSVPSLVLPAYDWVKVGLDLRLRERAGGLLVPTAEEARQVAEEAQRVAEQAQLAAEDEARRAGRHAAELEVALQAALAEVARLRARDDQG